MDEVLIDEKTYISSKRAAKITGYAKDYVGQLCREGRVPARLIGRSWYVLESAIQDHRFGDGRIGGEAHPPAPEANPASIDENDSEPQVSSTWESPRYETSFGEVLPPIRGQQSAPASTDAEEGSGSEVGAVVDNPPSEVQDQHPEQLSAPDSWKEWFDRVGDTEPAILDLHSVEPHIEDREEENSEPNANDEVAITPISLSYRHPPTDLLPSHEFSVQRLEDTAEWLPEERSVGVMTLLKFSAGVLAIVLAGLAFIGTGYLDRYITSIDQVRGYAGVDLYNR